MKHKIFNYKKRFEIWKDLECLEGQYQVSNRSRIRRVANNNIMKSGLNSNGYYCLNLRCITKHNQRLHRLVALAFVFNDSPETKIEVNHIDGDKSNNFYKNLEWVTHGENIRHLYHVLNHHVSAHTRYKISRTQKTKRAIKLESYPQLIIIFDGL